MEKNNNYEYQDLKYTSLNAAKLVVPHIITLFGSLPSRVMDLGGGVGGWCKALKLEGVKEVICIDHPSTPHSQLLINPEEFIACDFERETPEIIKSDIAISIEFAEHISERRSQAIVDFLTQSAQFVVFSAAIPGQGGVRHINEQRHEYWKKKFHAAGFKVLDILRPLIIFDQNIPYYIRQNIFIYVSENSDMIEKLSNVKRLCTEEFELVALEILKREHPIKVLIKKIISKLINKI